MSAPQVELTSTDLSDLDPSASVNQHAEPAPAAPAAPAAAPANDNVASAQQAAVNAGNSIMECKVRRVAQKTPPIVAEPS
jgi:hypothetical protein